MGAYVEFPAEQTLRPPGLFEDTRFFYFVLRADQARLRALCDRYLNAPSGGAMNYSPIGIVLLAFSHVVGLRSADADRGVITYKDIAFWVPVLGGKTKPLCLFPPYIFVDDASTMATGREVFGLPKQLGRFQMPLSLNELAGMAQPAFRAEVVGRLAPGGQNDWRTLLTLESSPAAPRDDEIHLLSVLSGLIFPAALRSFALPAWLSHLGAVPTVGLKQVRDAATPEAACYQAIVEAPLSTVRVYGKPRFLLDAFRLTLMNVPSHPVAESLGLSGGTQTVPLTVYFEATMRMDAGVVVWSAR